MPPQHGVRRDARAHMLRQCLPGGLPEFQARTGPSVGFAPLQLCEASISGHSGPLESENAFATVLDREPTTPVDTRHGGMDRSARVGR